MQIERSKSEIEIEIEILYISFINFPRNDQTGLEYLGPSLPHPIFRNTFYGVRNLKLDPKQRA